MANQNRTLLIALFVAVFCNFLFILNKCGHKEQPPIVVDETKWNNKIDSFANQIKNRDSIIEGLKIGIEAKASAIKQNQTKVNNDISVIDKYTNMYKLYDSLYSAR